MRVKIFYGNHSQQVEEEANRWLATNKISPEQIVVRVIKMRHDNLNHPAFTLYFEVYSDCPQPKAQGVQGD